MLTKRERERELAGVRNVVLVGVTSLRHININTEHKPVPPLLARDNTSREMTEVSVCILTVSDSCSQGQAEDLSGPLLASLVSEAADLVVAEKDCVADDVGEIRRVLVGWADSGRADIILTTGGTGFAERDVTPEATSSVLDRAAPGLVTAMLAGSLAVTPLAALARPAAGIRGRTVIINLPGSKKAVRECFGFLQPALKHAVDLLQNRAKPVKSTHAALQAGGHRCPHQTGGGGGGGGEVGGDGTVAGRARQSQWAMITVEAAQAAVLSECRALLHTTGGSLSVLGTEPLHYRAARGRLLCGDISARDPLPPFPASTKDGYAVLSSDGPGVRTVRGEASAGSQPGGGGDLRAGQVLRINTGAPVPPGADAVVMVEDTKLVSRTEDGQEEREVEIVRAPVVGQDIRPVGCDIKAGEKVLTAGTVLGPGELGLLAAVGVTEVVVSSLPTVTVLSTGNEIQEPGEQLLPGRVRDSNKTTLLALLDSAGIPARDGGIARDDLAALTEALRAALEVSDLVVTTGGVSMGDRDLLRQVLVSEFGAKIHFARVNMKPGKPTTFASCRVGGKPRLVVGLPGNPVSASVTAHLYLLPAARLLSGLKRPLPGGVRARLVIQGGGLSLDPRPEYLRVSLTFRPGEAVGEARPTEGSQMSSRQASMAEANGLMILPARSEALTVVNSGYEAEVILIGDLRVSA